MDLLLEEFLVVVSSVYVLSIFFTTDSIEVSYFISSSEIVWGVRCLGIRECVR